MKKFFSMFLMVTMLVSLVACGKTTTTEITGSGANQVEQTESSSYVEKDSTKKHKQTDYPKMEEIAYSFRNTVQYGEPVAVFDYTNNSNYTITRFFLDFKMKEGVTAEQLNLKKVVGDELVTNEEIPEMEPYVYDYIVCDPGETAENASCYMVYNTEPISTEQCDLMELVSAEIYFIGDDGREHVVEYSAVNNAYGLSEQTRELFTWIDNEFTEQLPKPETRVAEASMYKDYKEKDKLSVEAYDMTYDAYLAYVSALEEKGFQNKYPNEEIDYSYSAINTEGYEIYIRHLGHMQCMEIELEKVDTTEK